MQHHLLKDCHPIATKSCKHRHDDKNFTDSEIKCLPAENIIEPTNSPQRAQTVITANENGKNRLSIDLKSAYHQIPLLVENKIYTAFEANGKLYQFTRICFGLKNAVEKWTILQLKNDFKNTWAYLDNLSTAGNIQEKHNENFSKLLAAAKKHNFTFNKNRIVISVDTV